MTALAQSSSDSSPLSSSGASSTEGATWAAGGQSDPSMPTWVCFSSKTVTLLTGPDSEMLMMWATTSSNLNWRSMPTVGSWRRHGRQRAVLMGACVSYFAKTVGVTDSAGFLQQQKVPAPIGDACCTCSQRAVKNDASLRPSLAEADSRQYHDNFPGYIGGLSIGSEHNQKLFLNPRM